jgi:hypothetical protein
MYLGIAERVVHPQATVRACAGGRMPHWVAVRRERLPERLRRHLPSKKNVRAALPFNAQLFRPRSPSPSGAEPPSAQRVQQPGVPPACCERRVAVATGVGPIPARRGSGTPCKKPANLAVAGAEESPSFDDYKCTTQPQPLPPTLTPRVCCQLRLTTAPFARSPLVAELSGSASRTRCWS